MFTLKFRLIHQQIKSHVFPRHKNLFMTVNMNSASEMLCCSLLIIIAKVIAVNKSDVFTISTEGCTIPGFPLISDNIKSLMGPPKNKHNCSDNAHLVSANSSHIWVEKEAFPTFNIWVESEFYCCYRSFTPVVNITNIVYGNCKDFATIMMVEDEFVRTECYYLDDKIYDDFFVFPSMKSITPNRTNTASYNILILGIEGMSRMNFHRTMAKTSKLLLDKGFLQLLGYNKVGDNSFPNLFPAFTGRSFDDIKKECLKGTYVLNTEKCPFVWDFFKVADYYTVLGSDSIAGLFGTYEYSLMYTPTDFYLQPFFYEARVLFHKKYYDYHQCLGSKFCYKILLEYIYRLTNKLRTAKWFGMFWEESISHEEDLNNPSVMDEDYYNLLKNLEKDQYLENTLIIILSDHGRRWGDIVLTEQGRVEERLPILGILFPTDFRKKYKLAFKNFRDNCHRLTTPFDVHQTLLDLVDLKAISDHQIRQRTARHDSTSVGTSMFLEISRNRTCKSLNINEHWCTCYKGKKIKSRNKARQIAAKQLLKHINSLLSSFPQCWELQLKHVLHCSVVANNGEHTYSVTISTTPGDGIFDGTLIRDSQTWVVSGSVSRLNLYRNQSYCVNDNYMKMFCLCV